MKGEEQQSPEPLKSFALKLDLQDQEIKHSFESEILLNVSKSRTLLQKMLADLFPVQQKRDTHIILWKNKLSYSSDV